MMEMIYRGNKNFLIVLICTSSLFNSGCLSNSTETTAPLSKMIVPLPPPSPGKGLLIGTISTPQLASTNFSITVKALNKDGTINRNYSELVTLTVSAPGKFAIPVWHKFTPTFDQGVYRFNGLNIQANDGDSVFFAASDGLSYVRSNTITLRTATGTACFPVTSGAGLVGITGFSGTSANLGAMDLKVNPANGELWAVGNVTVGDAERWRTIVSSDKGNTWNVSDLYTEYDSSVAREIAFDPSSQSIYVIGTVVRNGTTYGIVRKKAAGDIWRTVDMGQKGTYRSVAVDTLGNVIVAYQDSTAADSDNAPGLIRTSDDGGASWRTVPLPTPTSTTTMYPIRSVFFDSKAVYYAGTSLKQYLYKSEDRKNWSLITAGTSIITGSASSSTSKIIENQNNILGFGTPSAGNSGNLFSISSLYTITSTSYITSKAFTRADSNLDLVGLTRDLNNSIYTSSNNSLTGPVNINVLSATGVASNLSFDAPLYITALATNLDGNIFLAGKKLTYVSVGGLGQALTTNEVSGNNWLLSRLKCTGE